MTDTYEDPPTRAELAAELGLAAEPRFRRRSLAAGYSGLKLDEYGMDREGRHYEEYDGGGQE